MAFLLFFADIFVPSLGLLTLSGLAVLVAGSYVLFDESQGVFVNRPLIWAIAAGLVGVFVVIGGFALSVWRRKPATGREGLVGAVGTVRRPLDPDGIVFVSGELWQATAAGDSAEAAAANRGARAGDRHGHGRLETLRASRHRGRGRGRWSRRHRRLASGGESGSAAPARGFAVKIAGTIDSREICRSSD